ncbi:hypothetical protein BDV33DRAFT_201096 [Aspergillus novoparasiticus]|uniref:FAD/NAD(P)-binding domain-containing protein n=1 Tax=Aspergillus novoparasiticus TaxID=986946 RepID=A0A5N6EZM1_9EURO|nr:hypothetical protein BDV33DRAFT_201096 [Aspergillus novoparasiticus]
MISVRSRFVFLGTGYDDYQEPLQANMIELEDCENIPGFESFQGKVIHPQFWPVGLDYTHKRIVVIGSGATAITLLPALATSAAHVTMLRPTSRLFPPRDSLKPLFQGFCPARWPIKSYAVGATIVIKLTSGEELHPDIIVTATGLKLRMAGGISITVDSEPYEISDHFAWRASMLEGLPNWMRSLGYANASWTLGSDTAAQLACRLLTRMRK